MTLVHVSLACLLLLRVRQVLPRGPPLASCLAHRKTLPSAATANAATLHTCAPLTRLLLPRVRQVLPGILSHVRQQRRDQRQHALQQRGQRGLARAPVGWRAGQGGGGGGRATR